MAMSSALEAPPVEMIASPEARPYLFTVDEFFRMIDLDIFPEDVRVGLWEGQVYEKVAKTQAHAAASIDVNMFLARALPRGWSISGENPLTVGPDKAPLPDLVVLRGIGKDYLKRRPEAADVGLVVEFSLTSLKIDTGSKLEAYARAGIVAYWVLNLKDNVIHAYESPIIGEGRYASMIDYVPGQSIPFTLDRVRVALIAVSDLLPIS